MPSSTVSRPDNRGMEEIAEFLGIQTATLNRAVSSVVVIVVFALGRWLFLRWMRSNFDEGDAQFRATKISNYVTTALIILSLLFIWIDALDSLTTYLGLVSAGIAIALGDLLKNMAGWFYVLTRRPFRIGDRVEVSGLSGDVIDIRLFRFTIMEVGNWVAADQSTGRLVHVPNGILFTNTLANYTEGFTHIWDEIPVTFTFESDWNRGETIVREAISDQVPRVAEEAGEKIRETAREYQIKVGALTPIVYLSVVDHGVVLTARYLVEARRRRTVAAALWRSILEKVTADDTVHFAYPTVRTYFEGPISVTNRPDE